MNPDPVIFAMANPVPEIYPDEAQRAGASIVATGRSDFPNQINNVLAFPGVFRGALAVRAEPRSFRALLATLGVGLLLGLAALAKVSGEVAERHHFNTAIAQIIAVD